MSDSSQLAAQLVRSGCSFVCAICEHKQSHVKRTGNVFEPCHQPCYDPIVELIEGRVPTLAWPCFRGDHEELLKRLCAVTGEDADYHVMIGGRVFGLSLGSKTHQRAYSRKLLVVWTRNKSVADELARYHRVTLNEILGGA